MTGRVALPVLVWLALALGCGDAIEPEGDLGSEIVRAAEVDWSFAVDLPMASLQTSSPPRSRAVWLLVHEGDLYVPTGIARRSTWPKLLQQDPIVLLRVMDRLYLRHATWVSDNAELATLREAVRAKYGTAPRSDDAGNGFFRMDPAPGRG